MKNFTLGTIYCQCSIKMHCRGKHIQMYEHTSKKQRCPNCGKIKEVKIGGKNG